MPDLFDGHGPTPSLNALLAMATGAAQDLGITAEVLWITRGLAERILHEWHYDLQRTLIPNNVERLAAAMRRETFVRGTPIFVCQTPDGKRFLVNAQHTLNAVVECDIPVVLVLITLRVPDMEAIGRVYATFDQHRLRSKAASWQAFKGAPGTRMENTALTGIPFILGDFGTNKQISREATMEELQANYLPAIETLEAAFTVGQIGGATALVKAAHRAGVVAVGLYTARYQPTRAYDFWNYVITESHPEHKHSTRALARYFRDSKGAGQTYQQQDIRATAQAWNLFWEDGRVTHLAPGAIKAVRILGTPWHKGKPVV